MALGCGACLPARLLLLHCCMQVISLCLCKVESPLRRPWHSPAACLCSQGAAAAAAAAARLLIITAGVIAPGRRWRQPDSSLRLLHGLQESCKHL